MDIVKIAGACGGPSSMCVIGKLLANCPELFDYNHLWRVDVDRVVIKVEVYFGGGVFELAQVNSERPILAGSNNLGVESKFFETVLETVMFSLFDELEAQFVAAPPGLLILGIKPRLRFQHFVKHHVTYGIEAVPDGVKEASAGIFEIWKISFQGEVEIEGRPIRDAVDQS